ncbi:hypothetical protein AA106555_0766 [Neokomagataea thailandica NBRC 106555]|nr:hypothetical protein AA106555_0766 [Neokomagataea thailandica NBRC 106555]
MAPLPAKVVQDLSSPGLAPYSLKTLSDGRWIGLDADGNLLHVNNDGSTTPVALTSDGTNASLHFTTLTTQGSEIWAVTTGSNPELVKLTAEGAVQQRLSLTGTLRPESNIAALQMHGETAFLADEGAPAIIGLSLKTGKAQRFLPNDASLIGRSPLRRHGVVQVDAKGIPSTGGNVRFLLQDPNQKWLFYGPLCSPLYRIDPNLFTDPNFTPVEQFEGINEWWHPTSIGGITILPNETFISADIDRGSLLAFGPSRLPQTLLLDPRLLQSEGITSLPASQKPTAPLQIAVQIIENDMPHILRIALP